MIIFFINFNHLKKGLNLMLLVLLMILFQSSMLYAQANHSYPRTVVWDWGNGAADWYAKFDLFFGPISMDKARKIKDIDPTTMIIASVIDLNTFSNMPVPEEWYAKDTNGNKVYIYNNSRALIDITNYCPGSSQYNGKRYNEWVAEYMVDKVDLNIIDGIGSHGIRNNAWKLTNIDYDRNGINDLVEHGPYNSGWFNNVLVEGLSVVVDKLRSYLNDNQVIVLNSGRFHTFLSDKTNGCVLEDEKYVHNFNYFRNNFDLWMSASPNPQTIIYDAMGNDKNDYHWMRFQMGVAMYGNAYVGYHEDDAQEHYYNSYYDEMDLNLGFPTGPMQLITSTGERGRGTYVRFFDNGAVILNVNEHPQTVTDNQISTISGYDGPYYRLLGGQDSDFNNGELFNQVNLYGELGWDDNLIAGDAIFLMKEPTTIITDIIIDSESESTSPGSQVVELSSNWTQTEDCINSWQQSLASYRDMYGLAFSNAGSGQNIAKFIPTINIPGNYTVYLWNSDVEGRQEGSEVPYTIYHASGISSGIINQRQNHGKWLELGTFTFNVGTTGFLELNNNNTDGIVVADAVKFVFLNNTEIVDTNPPSIISINPLTSTTIEIQFTERLDRVTAENTNNYTINNGINVIEANLSSSLNTVTLITTVHDVGNLYNLTVNNIRDLAVEPNILQTNTMINYTGAGDPLEISLSADGMYTLYINGNLINSNERWQDAEFYEIPTTSNDCIIAIKAENYKAEAGLIAKVKFANIVYISNENWKISTTLIENWNTLNFNDIDWLKATSYGLHGQAEPWANYLNVDGIDLNDNVEWIWSNDYLNDSVVYFRLKIQLGTEDPPPSPPMDFQIKKE